MGRLALATLVAFALGAGLSSAQARFELVDQNSVAGAPGLRLMSVRDNATKTCYVVFVADAPGGSDPVPTVEVDIPSAMAARDRRLADLLRGFQQEQGAIPGTIIPNPMKYDWQAEAAQFEFALSVLANGFSRLDQQIARAASGSHTGIAAVSAPCTAAVALPPTDRLPEKRR